MSHADAITLGGQSFAVKGPIVAQPLSEFTSGLKVGRATYDEREHAFFLVLDDFSGGIGYFRTDIREALGTAWDNPGGVDIRRPRRILLPPYLNDVINLTAPTAQNISFRLPSKPFATSALGVTGAEDGWAFFGFGNTLYNVDKARASVAVSDTLTGAYMISHVEEFNEYNTTNRYLYYCGEGTGGVTKLRRSADPFNGSWADASSKIIEDFIIFDNKIIATTPIAQIIFSTDGVNWNDDDADDGQPIWQSGVGRVQFVGVHMAPWGAPAVWFINQGTLWVLDFYSRTAYPFTAIGSRGLFTGCTWNGFLYVTDGQNVWQIDPNGRETVRNIGPYNRYGRPIGALGGGGIRYLYAGEEYLYAIWTSTVFLTSTPTSRLLVYNGSGWTTLGENTSDAVPLYCFIDYLPAIGFATDPRHIWMPYANTTTGTTLKAKHWNIPQSGDHPTQGVDKFADGPISFVTGWIDGGFHEIDGTAFRVEIDAHVLGSTETVKVEYQIGVDGTIPTDLSAYTQLVDSAGASMVFNSHDDIGYFNTTTPKKGTKFRQIRFRVTLDRGSTTTVSPELVALVFVYDKKPKLRIAWAFEIDVARMIAEGTLIDASAATMQNVFEKLISLWNTYPLLTLSVPSVATGSSAREVMISSFPMSFDDFRTEVATREGSIKVTCLETVNV